MNADDDVHIVTDNDCLALCGAELGGLPGPTVTGMGPPFTYHSHLATCADCLDAWALLPPGAQRALSPDPKPE